MKSKFFMTGIISAALIFGFVSCDTGTNGNGDIKISSDEALYELFGGVERPKLKLLKINETAVSHPPVIEFAHYNYGYFWRYGVSNDEKVRIDYEIWDNDAAIKQRWHDNAKYFSEERDGKFVVFHGADEYVYELVNSTTTEYTARNASLEGTWAGTWDGKTAEITFESTGKFRFSDETFAAGSSWDGAWESDAASGTSGTVSVSLATVYPIVYPASSANNFVGTSFSISGNILTAFGSTWTRQP
jgi:hypothetical protein